MPQDPATPSGPKAPTGTGLAAPAARDRAVVRPPSAPAPVDGRSKTKDLLVHAPKLEVPKGGGAVRGIGEKFQANPVTGTASFSVPIALSPGRNGFTPALSLAYDSGAGNGPFGIGWSVGVPSIQRKTDRGLPRYRDAEDSDTFVISDAEDLVPYQSWSGSAWAEPDLADVTEGEGDAAVTYARRRYRPRVEAGFARMERWTSAATGATHWRTWSKENVRRIYGLDAEGTVPSDQLDGDGAPVDASVARRAAGRLADPDDASRVFRWYLQEERDEVGNLIRYEYAAEDRAGAAATQAEAVRATAKSQCAYVYLKRVLYGNVTPGSATGGWLFEAVFDYGDHSGDGTASPPTAPPQQPDGTWATRSDVQSSFRSGFDVRCYRLCARVLLFHRFAAPTADSSGVIVRSTELAHSASAVATTLTSVTHRGWRKEGDDWTVAAMPAVAFAYGEATVDATVRFVTGLDDLPQGLDTSRWQWTDLDGEGLAGLLTEQAGSWFYKRNDGAGALGAASAVGDRPSLAALGDPQSRLMDVDGDGRMEVVSLRPGLQGSFARDAAGNWQGFRPFRTVPTTPLNDPNARLLDVDGDGRADLLVTEEDCLTWYPSEGRDGWSKAERRRRGHDEDRGPTFLFANEAETIFLADMTGDGLTDLVRVRNGNVCYWPNRGYARFGAKVQMAGAPRFDTPDRFDPKRVRLADVDGSGPADLVYLGPTAVRVWANESGNRWAAAATPLPALPGVEDTASIQVADLLGDGTACLVWSSPLLRDALRPLRYVRLMADGKPYLLKSVTNNLGRTTTLTYAPSTQFYVADRRAGTPWATRLPFPVQVLETVTVADAVTGWSNATTYAYHHGYHDPDEREFRGFGKVEQWDTETAPAVTEGQLPPVRTVTWFHTGAWRQEGTLEDAYAAEYFAGDGAAFARTACAIGIADGDASPLRAREQREAYRALKGKPLRQEVYAEDGDANAGVPYTVTETAFTASRLQRADDDNHGSFLVTPLQTLTYHYERDASDPRIQQQRTLAVDAYGTVLRTLTVACPRRSGSAPEQTTGVALVTRTEVIHDVDDTTNPDRWHVGVPYRARSWQFSPDGTFTRTTGGTAFFAALIVPDATFGTAGADGSLTDWLDVAEVTGGTATTPVIDWDEVAPGSGAWLRKLADKVTTYDNGGSEADAGTMGALALPFQAYQLAYTATQADALDALLGDLGVSVTVVDQGYVAGTTSPFSGIADVDGTWARSGTQARDSAHFYVATAFTDPFGATTAVSWHSSYLFAESATDAVGNVVAVAYDLVALAPSSLTDPNRNVTQARYDALGRVTAVARASDTGDGETDLDDPSQTFSYDLTVVPAVAHASVRDLHASETGTPSWIETYAYSDGAGTVVMQKATAADDQWVGSGRVVLNNKGLPIKQYEPFFAADFAFEAEEGFGGVTPVITYDPVGRAIRVDLPNGTLRRVSFDPWSQVTWDENDTIDESAASSDLKATVPDDHKSTPTVVRLDVQGRPYQTLEYRSAWDADDPDADALVTTLTLDVMGNPTAVVDARAAAATTPWATQAQTFDLLGRPVLTSSADGGDATALLDAAGSPRFVWKSGDLCEEGEYDALRRRVRTWEWVTSGTVAKTLRERFLFGEALFESGGYDPRDDDLRGRLYQVFDGAGNVVAAYDWKGNPTGSTRRFYEADDAMPAWTDGGTYPFAADDHTTVAAFASGNEAALESGTGTSFVSAATFDALDRVVTATAPDGQVTANGYDAGGRLVTVDVGTDHYVTGITYNARGQRLSITYGNDSETDYTYEADTFRLSTLVTTRPVSGDRLTGLQSLTYSYDPVGNILGIVDAAQDVYYTDNATVTPDQTFAYDALYRLTSASGREKGDRVEPWSADPDFLGLPASGADIRNYTEAYTYDEVGNVVTMVHKHLSTTLWTRSYAYSADSNRLVTTTEVPGTVTYVHDVRGNIVYLPPMRFSSTHVPNIEVTFRDQMRKVYLNDSDTSFYFYDSGGQRVRKVVKTGPVEDRRYVGSYESWTRTVSGDLRQARTTLHVMDGQSRVVMIETKTITDGDADGTVVKRYQLGNHLGTACVEVDAGANVITYEEYHPYGSTAWWSNDGDTEVSRKRYRYTGMERDEETGLQCHGVRYYAPWLGRWTSADPIGLGDGVNRYGYARGNPVGGFDPSGLWTFVDSLVLVASWAGYGESDPSPISPGTPVPPSSPALTTSDSGSACLTTPLLTAAGKDQATKIVAARSVGSLPDPSHPPEKLVREATMGPIPTAFDPQDLEHGSFGVAGTIAAGSKMAGAVLRGDAHELGTGNVFGTTPGEQALIEAGDLAGAIIGVGADSRDRASQYDRTEATRPVGDGLTTAEMARDALAAAKGRKFATYAGGYLSGKVVSGASSNPSGCAEDDVERQLPGANKTGAKGWRRDPTTRELVLTDIEVCLPCQEKYPESQFPPNVPAAPGGAWKR